MVIIGRKFNCSENHYSNIPKQIPIEVGRYALDHRTKNALEKFSKKYLKFTFKRISINLWKALLKKSEDNQTFNKKDRPNLFYLKHCLNHALETL